MSSGSKSFVSKTTGDTFEFVGSSLILVPQSPEGPYLNYGSPIGSHLKVINSRIRSALQGQGINFGLLGKVAYKRDTDPLVTCILCDLTGSFRLLINFTGNFNLVTILSGFEISHTATSSFVINNFDPFWFHVTYQGNNGAGGHTVTYRISYDFNPITRVGNWITVATSTVGLILSMGISVEDFKIGAMTPLSQESSAGKRIYHFEVLNGLEVTSDPFSVCDPADALISNPQSNLPAYDIQSMSGNMILRYDTDGSVWGKISRPEPFKTNQLTTGTVYINGTLYTVTSYEFVKIIPA